MSIPKNGTRKTVTWAIGIFLFAATIFGSGYGIVDSIKTEVGKNTKEIAINSEKNKKIVEQIETLNNKVDKLDDKTEKNANERKATDLEILLTLKEINVNQKIILKKLNIDSGQ